MGVIGALFAALRGGGRLQRVEALGAGNAPPVISVLLADLTGTVLERDLKSIGLRGTPRSRNYSLRSNCEINRGAWLGCKDGLS